MKNKKTEKWLPPNETIKKVHVKQNVVKFSNK